MQARCELGRSPTPPKHVNFWLSKANCNVEQVKCNLIKSPMWTEQAWTAIQHVQLPTEQGKCEAEQVKCGLNMSKCELDGPYCQYMSSSSWARQHATLRESNVPWVSANTSWAGPDRDWVAECTLHEPRGSQCNLGKWCTSSSSNKLAWQVKCPVSRHNKCSRPTC